MASIIPHGDKWRAQVAIAGVRDSKVFRTKREASGWAVRRETEIRAEQGKKPSELITLHSLLARYVEEVSPQKRGASKEVIRLNAIIRRLPNIPLSDVGPEVIQRYRDERFWGALHLTSAGSMRNSHSKAMIRGGSIHDA